MALTKVTNEMSTPLDAAGVTAAGALMDSELTSIASVKDLNQGVATGDSPTFAALTSTGEITANGGIALGDNDKATFGASDDLQIYHDGSNGIINNAGSGSLIIQDTDGTGDIYIRPKSGQTAIAAYNDNTVEIAHSGNVKLYTTSTGIGVTGTATMDSARVGTSTVNYSGTDLTVGDNADSQNGLAIQTSTSGIGYVLFGDGSGASAYRGEINYAHSTDSMTLKTAGASRLNISSAGIDVTGTATMDGLVVSDSSLQVKLEEADGVYNPRLITYFDSSGTHLQHTWSSGASNLIFEVGGVEGAGTERMRIDSSGNVGIGNSNPAGYGKFLVQGTGNLINANASSGAASFQLYEGGQGRFAIETLNGSAGAKFLLAGTERMRIDSSGNVGIGTDSPISKLNVKGTQGNWRVDPDSVSGEIQVLATTTANDGFRNFRLRSNASIFETGGTEAMRIDSSGNLLVGKTGLGIGVVGTEARAGGQLLVTADADNPLDLNRKTSDGVIALFRKDSATVGSIGTEGGNLTIDGSTATGKSGIEFSGAEWYPRDGGANSNGAISLGDTSNRFKDLYLSGGVYLGGTGSANKLDDYEEGTWTPVASNYDGIMTVNSATYTKIGNLVTVRAKVSFDATADVSGVNLAGLPFTTTGPDKGNGGFVTSSTVSSASRLAAVGSSSIFLLADDGSNVTYATVASTSLQFVFIYETTA